MIQQKSMHLKLDNVTYAWLRQLQFRTEIPFNRLVNLACIRFVEMQQARQRAKMSGREEEWTRAAKEVGITSLTGLCE